MPFIVMTAGVVTSLLRRSSGQQRRADVSGKRHDLSAGTKRELECALGLVVTCRLERQQSCVGNVPDGPWWELSSLPAGRNLRLGVAVDGRGVNEFAKFPPDEVIFVAVVISRRR